MKVAAPGYLIGGVLAEAIAVVVAVRQGSSGAGNPFLVSLFMGIGFAIPVVLATWTAKRDRRQVDQDRIAEIRANEKRHEENQRAIEEGKTAVDDLKRLIEGGKGYDGLIYNDRRNRRRRHFLMNQLAAALGCLVEMSRGIARLAEKVPGVEYAEDEINQDLRGIIKKLQETDEEQSR